MKSKWTTGFPTEVGTYWFYGYRYGKDGGKGRINKPELCFVRVHKVRNGIMYISEGQFMYRKEIECPHFCKAELPELPEIE